MATNLATVATVGLGNICPVAGSGPFQDSSGFFYAVIKSATGGVLDIYKASAADGTWASESIGWTATSSMAFDVVQDGDTLHFATVDLNTDNSELRYRSLSLNGSSVASWDAAETQVDTDANWTATNSFLDVSIAISNGTTRYLCIASCGREEKIHGSNYRRVDIWKKTLSGGTWATGGDITASSGVEQSHVFGLVAPGAGEFVHVCWRDVGDAVNYQIRSWDVDANTYSTLVTQAWGSVPVSCHDALGYDVGGTWEIRFLYADVANDDFEVLSCNEDGSGHAAVRGVTTSSAIAAAGNRPQGKLVHDPITGKEYLAHTEDSTAAAGFRYASRAEGSTAGAFGSSTVVDATVQHRYVVGLVAMSRNSSNFLDMLSFDQASTNTDYWELEELTAGGGIIAPPEYHSRHHVRR